VEVHDMPIYTYFFSFLLGASVASFLNVVAYSVPIGANWAIRRSACVHCQAHLTARELIPIFSYLAQKGRCRSCSVNISLVYPLIELAGGLLFIIPLILLDQIDGQQLAHTWLFFSLLITVTLTDLYYGLIPNKILAVFGALLFMVDPSIFAAVMGLALFLVAALLGRWLFGQETVGGGDVKCYFVIGLALDVRALLVSVVISCGLALGYVLFVAEDRREPVKFAPFIALGAIMTMIALGI